MTVAERGAKCLVVEEQGLQQQSLASMANDSAEKPAPQSHGASNPEKETELLCASQ